jgi:hypothetical protein
MQASCAGVRFVSRVHEHVEAMSLTNSCFVRGAEIHDMSAVW